jgi:zinc transporter 1/2/3
MPRLLWRIWIQQGLRLNLPTWIVVSAGVGIHGTYNANSATSITLLGVLDSICAGILIYMGLVQFMSAWFTNNEEFMRKPLWHIFCVYLALLAGMIAMASIGIWA